MTPALIRNSIGALIGDISQLRGEVAWLRRTNEALRCEIAAHGAERAALRAENEAWRAKYEASQAENADLRRRLGLDSPTSSKPPSSDGLKKKPRIAGSLCRAALKRETPDSMFSSASFCSKIETL